MFRNGTIDELKYNASKPDGTIVVYTDYDGDFLHLARWVDGQHESKIAGSRYIIRHPRMLVPSEGAVEGAFTYYMGNPFV